MVRFQHLYRGCERPDKIINLARYRDAFPIDYREVYPPQIAVGDIRVLEGLTPERPLGVDFYRQGGAAAARVGLKVRAALIRRMALQVSLEPLDARSVTSEALGEDTGLISMCCPIPPC